MLTHELLFGNPHTNLLYPNKLVTAPPILNMIDNKAQILIPRLVLARPYYNMEATLYA